MMKAIVDMMTSVTKIVENKDNKKNSTRRNQSEQDEEIDGMDIKGEEEEGIAIDTERKRSQKTGNIITGCIRSVRRKV